MAEEEKEVTVQVGFRLPESLLKKIDDLALQLTKRLGFKVSRTDVATGVLDHYLDSYKELQEESW
jgi:hypothetical protein